MTEKRLASSPANWGHAGTGMFWKIDAVTGGYRLAIQESITTGANHRRAFPTVTEILSVEKMLCGIVGATDGRIWFGSLRGVYRYDGKTIADFNHKERQWVLLCPKPPVMSP
jgi:hypothetical protein